jgi:hypothetical protein
MSGQDDAGRDDDEVTPIERPGPVLHEHRVMIKALSDAAMQISHAVNLLGDAIHELRVARDPIGNATKEKICRFGIAIRDVGTGIAAAFTPGLAKETP